MRDTGYFKPAVPRGRWGKQNARWRGRGGGVQLTAAAALLAGAYGLSLAAIDDSMWIADQSTPANNYDGTPGAKVTTTRASGAMYWNAGGVLTLAGNNELRRDFDPRLASTVERCGYLIEEARTNLALRSEDASHADWTKANSTITADSVIAPDGTLTADTITTTTTNTTPAGISQTFTGTAAAYTFSFFVKKISGSDFIRGVLSSGGSPRSVWFDLATGQVATQGASITGAIVSCGNGIYRCAVTTTCAATTETMFVRLATADNNASNATAGHAIAVWGMQVELGSFASSYIPTTSTSVTRAADLVTLAGTLFPLNSSEGTIYSKFMTMGGANAQYLTTLDNGGNTESVQPLRLNTGPMRFVVVDGNAHQAGTVGIESSASVAVMTVSTSAGAYKLNDMAVAQAGETVQVDLAGTMPTLTQIVFGNRALDGLRALNGWLFEALYKPVRETNSQLQYRASGYASDALLLMGTETQGLTFAATDQSMSILDTGTPANVYTGELSAKLGSIRTSAGMTYLSSGLLGWGPENLLIRSTLEGGGAAPTGWSGGGTGVSAPYATNSDGSVTYEQSGTAERPYLSRLGGITAGVGEVLLFSAQLEYTDGVAQMQNLMTWASLPSGATIQMQFNGSNVAVNYVPTEPGIIAARLTVGSTAGTPIPRVGLGASSNATGVIRFSRPQVERTASRSTWKPTQASAYYGLRLDYDSRLTGGPGYLVEEARTNLALRSQELDNAQWTATRASVSANAIAAPDGTTTADKVVEDSTAASSHFVQSAGITVTGGASYTYSFYAKAGERTWCYAAIRDSTDKGAYVNLSTGALGAAIGSGAVVTTQSVANGWYRIVIVIAATSSTSVQPYCALANADSGVSYNGDGVSGAYFWGAQLEAGAFATSYIPTTTASVTRAADIPILTGTAFPLNQNEGTLIGKVVYLGTNPTLAQYILSLDSSTTDVILCARLITGIMRYNIIRTGSTQVQLDSSATIANFANTSAAYAYKLNDSAVVQAGEAVQTDAVCTMPTTNSMGFGNRSAGDRPSNLWLRHGRYFPTRKSNADLAVLAAAA